MVCFTLPPFLPAYLWANMGPQGLPATTLWGLLAAAWPAQFHNPPPRWVRQSPPCRKSSLPWLPVSAPPTGLDECFFFISLVVRLPCGLIFCQFWLFFDFKLWVSFFLLWEEAQCVYLRLHLGRKSKHLSERLTTITLRHLTMLQFPKHLYKLEMRIFTFWDERTTVIF